MTKHTPGPWRIGKTPGSIVSDHPIDTAGKNTGHNEVDYYGGYLVAESIYRVEDRRLIAAAPELLEACKAAWIGAKHEACKYTDDDPDWTWHCCNWSEVVELLEKAIAKAEGREME